MKARKSSPRKVIWSIAIPLYLFIIACYFAEKLSFRGNPFEVSQTWWIWICYITIIVYIEDLIYSR